MTSYITVNTRFEGTHFYPAAPDEVAFLRVPHRHEFHVSAIISVTHDDRELEFIMVKSSLDRHLAEWPRYLGVMSCEMMAKSIMQFLFEKYGSREYSIKVSEDGENGALVIGAP